MSIWSGTKARIQIESVPDPVVPLMMDDGQSCVFCAHSVPLDTFDYRYRVHINWEGCSQLIHGASRPWLGTARHSHDAVMRCDSPSS